MTTTFLVATIIIVLVALAAFLTKGDLVIERRINVNKPLQKVFDYLKFSKNKDNFSVWNMADPGMHKEYSGTDGTVGFVYRWNSITNKNVGAGEQETKRIKDGGAGIDYEVRFVRPMQNVAKSNFVFTKIDKDQTRVQWGFYSKSKFPMSLMKPVFQRMLGKDLEKSLLNLKIVLEKE